MMNSFEWTNAGSIGEAVAQLNNSVAIKAGGIDLIDRLKEGLDTPSRLVNILNIKGLDGVSEDAKAGLRIGPLVTLAELDTNKIIRSRYVALADAAGHAATPQIRNVATIGGNLLQRPRCWYFRQAEFNCRKKGGDRCFAIEGENQYHAIFDNSLCAIVHPSALSTALVAFNARVVLTGAKGTRGVELEKFFTTPEEDVRRENSIGADELITEIVVPSLSAQARSCYLKLGEKESFDWPIADVAVVLNCARGGLCEKASIVLGAAAPVPLRASKAEAVLAGKVVNEESAREAARAAIEGATPLSENAYKLPIFEAIVRRAILAAASGGA
jgi:xanthine dehydrogenase YagS FAD-binding subunit